MKKITFLTAFLLTTNLLLAQIINIPGDYPTIQQGINAANTGDTVLVQPGTYNEHLNFNGKEITVGSLFLTTQDTSYITQTEITGSNSDTEVILFENDETINTILCGLKITFGMPNLQYGIYCSNASPTLKYLKISGTGDSLRILGGIYCNYSESVLDHVTIVSIDPNYCASSFENSNIVLSNFEISDNSGRGIYCVNTSLVLEDGIIIKNNGGGILCNESDLFLSNVTINRDYLSCKESNADIENLTLINCNFFFSGLFERSNVKIVNSQIANNSAFCGGAFYFDDSEGLIDYVTVSENEAINGGGIYFSGSNFLIRNSSFTGNKADSINNASGTGGAIFCDHSQLTIQNTLFKGNSVNYTIKRDNMNSVLFCTHNSNAKLMNSTITGNEQYDDIFGNRDVNLISCHYKNDDSSKVELINTLVYFNDSLPNSLFGYGVTASYSNIEREYGVCQGEGNINEDPMFVMSGDHPYQINDYSPCIDAGTPDTSGLNLPELDLAGNPRLVNNRIDMGAYEWNLFVGVEDPVFDEPETANVSIYPNPATSTATLSGQFATGETLNISMFNTSGSCLRSWEFANPQTKQQEFTLDLSNLPPGIYFLRLQAGVEVMSKKVVKL